MRITITLLLFSLFFAACQNGTTTDTSGEAASTDESAAAATPPTKYKVTPFTPSASFPDAVMVDMMYLQGKFTFNIAGESYQLGQQTPDAGEKMCANSGKGQHIHLIVDSLPYAARYTAEFDDYNMPEGEHFVLAFLSRSYHESLKTPTAFKAMKVNVEGDMFKTFESINDPMLFYSRPKGTYVGKADTEKVMLDFYLVNATLGDRYKVKAEINGEETHTLDTWQPYYIEGLPMGKNTVKLTLIDDKGNPVDTPLNPVTREFTLKEDAVEG